MKNVSSKPSSFDDFERMDIEELLRWAVGDFNHCAYGCLASRGIDKVTAKRMHRGHPMGVREKLEVKVSSCRYSPRGLEAGYVYADMLGDEHPLRYWVGDGTSMGIDLGDIPKGKILVMVSPFLPVEYIVLNHLPSKCQLQCDNGWWLTEGLKIEKTNPEDEKSKASYGRMMTARMLDPDAWFGR